MSKAFLFFIAIAVVYLPIFGRAQEETPSEVDQRLSAMEKEFLANYDAQVSLPFGVKVSDLNAKYVTALERALEAATQAGKLDEALMLRDEKKFVAEEKGIPQADAANAPASLKQMRDTYRSELKKLEADRDLVEAPLLATHDATLEAYQTLLTTEKKLDEALKVREARQTLPARARARRSEPEKAPATVVASVPMKPVEPPVVAEADTTSSAGMPDAETDFEGWLKTVQFNHPTGNIYAIEGEDFFAYRVKQQRIDRFKVFSIDKGQRLIQWGIPNLNPIALHLDRKYDKFEHVEFGKDLKGNFPGKIEPRDAALFGEKILPNAAADSSHGPASATKDAPFENGLRMKFVPVSITGGASDGKIVLFSIWETRVKDYFAFANDTDREWLRSPFPQTGDHPAVFVSWEDAVAFCAWLTATERAKKRIGAKEVYRLPSDHEWSCAVGIGGEENPAASPLDKSGKVEGHPWGKEFPPSNGAGNFLGEGTKGGASPDRTPIAGYNDGFEHTAPVGSFAPNDFGIHDLGGNVCEWCLDLKAPTSATIRVVRGGSWTRSLPDSLRSSTRSAGQSTGRNTDYGFRVVLEVESDG